ncbi:hypothetical protein HYY69_05535 [Candidatus Woesearchaeota archaeon]|nr:hypothetical protein [Candidatus Woesearchaeota archaeon]
MVQEQVVIKREINITYETLFDLLVREKNRDELQKLSESYFNDVNVYLREKERALDTVNNTVSKDDLKRVEQQLENAKRIIKELYDRREKKIVMMALNCTRVNETKSNTDTLLEHEKQLFSALIKLLIQVREGILTTTLEQQIGKTNENVNEASKVLEQDQQTTKRVRMNVQLSKFVDTNLQSYGPFESGEITTLPLKFANLLISAGKATEEEEKHL